jgi:macrodomain Ter protein organizer (MatP/YcbG family)|tara:strand:- start:141 stop:320 length:180 start_codon:yes stop_codon:yes gene_type:complete
MTDTKQYKSVAVDLATHKKLAKLATDDHRKISQQITKLVSDSYQERYGNEVNSGIGSAA